MEQFFYHLARQSLTAGWMILALLALRPLLKKAPRALSCLLWGLAAVRLVVPFSLESPVSLVPQQIAEPVRITPITPISPVYYNGPALQNGTTAGAQVVSQSISWQAVVPYVWLIGVAAMGIYALVSYLRLARRVRISIPIKDRLYLCDQVSSPFVLGLLRPKIYLPSDMPQPMTDHVLSHERAHLRRGDHLWKPLGYALLSIHWFNPLCWLAYVLFCRDMEQACDETVIKNMTSEEKKAYSTALLHCSLPRSAISACPVAFGQISIKQRIQGVLNYRKPALWVVAASAVLCMVLAACFLTDPVKATDADVGKTDGATVWEYPVYSNPSESAGTLCRIVPGEDYTILRTEPIGSNLWAYVECQDGKIFGWILLDGADEPSTNAAGSLISNGSGEPSAFTRQTTIYSAPSQQSREVAKAEAGEACSLLRREPIGNDIWGYVECRDDTRGWILLDAEEAALIQIPEAAVTADKPEGGFFTSHRQTIVYSAPDTSSRELAWYSAGMPVRIDRLERIGESIWGVMEYQDGETLGWIPLDAEEAASFQAAEATPLASGTVIGPERLNVRSGAGAYYPAVDLLTPGSQVAIYEVVNSGNQQWGRIGIDRWVCMSYIECQKDAGVSDAMEATQDEPPREQTEEGYTFPQRTVIRSAPSQQAREVAWGEAGEDCTIVRREFVNGGSWGYVRLQNRAQGWAHFVEEDEALNYFRDYVAAYQQPTPEAAEAYLYFETEYAREFFRDNYAPVTGWYPSGIFRVNENLWGILFSEVKDNLWGTLYPDGNSERTVYSFVGRMEDRLYVFQNVHQVPQALTENLDVASFEEENAMYLTQGYLECYSVIKRLLPFANPARVTVEGKWEDSAAAHCAMEDVVCGTDTWRVASQPDHHGAPVCTIRLTAADGSTAEIADSTPVVMVTRPDGSQEWYQAAFTGEELVGMLYSWARELA